MKNIKNFKLFLESKQTEFQAIKVLDIDIEAEYSKILNDFKDIDKSKNQILLPSIAYFYKQNVDLNSLNQVFSKIPDLDISVQYTKDGIKIKNDIFNNWIKFSEKIDAMYSALKYKKQQKIKKKKSNIELGSDIETEIDIPIFDKNNIKIYSGDDVGKCIRLGKGKSFCISQPANKMYQTYRDTKNSTFYFIYDENQKDNPLNIVVFDNTSHGIELTDETNNTGTIYKYGENVENYIKYLKLKDVPVEKLLINKSKTEIEKKENKLLGVENKNLKWFIDLSSDYKSKYIGRGYKLSNEQFDYIFDNNIIDLLNQYVNLGHDLNNYQFKKIENKSNILKTYIRTCYQKLEIDDTYYPYYEILKYFNKYGFLNGNRIYPNEKSNTYYKVVLNPTIESIEKYNITIDIAAEHGYTDIVKLLIDNGVGININDNSVIKRGIINGHYDIVKLMIDNGVDITISDNYAIRISVRFGYYDIVKLLIDNGADITVKNNISIITAVENGYYDIVKLLIDNGADITVMDNVCIRRAVEFGYTDIVKLLIDNGADITVMDNYVIRTAAEKGHYDIIKMLIDNGVDITIKKNYVIRAAAAEGYIDIVRLSIDNGADVTVYDNYAIKMAVENGHDDVVKLLKKHGAVL